MVITEATGFPSLPSWTSVRTIFHSLPRMMNSGHTVRQHQSAFVPLGPHVERDVPRRLIQLVRYLILSEVPTDEILSCRPTRESCFSILSNNMLSSLRPPDRGGGPSSRFYILPRLTRPIL